MSFSRPLDAVALVALALALAPALALAAPAEPLVPPLTPPDGVAPAAGPTPAPGATAVAARPARAVQLALTMGFDKGFTILDTVPMQDGSSVDIVANQGIFMSVGASFLPLWDGRLRTQATLGFKYNGVEASNGKLTLVVFPLEVMEAMRLDPLRLSAGLVYLYRPKVTGTGAAADRSVAFDDSLGAVLQAEWVFGAPGGLGWSIGPRFVWQRLQTRGGGEVHDANALGLVFTFPA